MEKDRLINLDLTLPRGWVLSPKLALTDGSLRNPRSSESSKTGRVSGKGTPINGAPGAHRRTFGAPKSHYSETAESDISPGPSGGPHI